MLCEEPCLKINERKGGAMGKDEGKGWERDTKVRKSKGTKKEKERRREELERRMGET